jgi:hypothetical protein
MENFKVEKDISNVWHCRHCNAFVETEGIHLCETMKKIGKIHYATWANGSLIVSTRKYEKDDFPPGFGKKKSDS